MTVGESPAARVGRRFVGDDRLAGGHGRAEEGVQVPKNHARGLALLVKFPRGIVPRDVGYGVGLQVGLPFLVIKHLADEAVFALSVDKDVGKQPVEQLVGRPPRDEGLLTTPDNVAQTGCRFQAAGPCLDLGEIADHAQITERLAGLVAQDGESDKNRNALAVLAEVGPLGRIRWRIAQRAEEYIAAADFLAVALGEVGSPFGQFLRIMEERDRRCLAYHLIGAVAEQLLGRRIEGQDRFLQIDGNDGHPGVRGHRPAHRGLRGQFATQFGLQTRRPAKLDQPHDLAPQRLKRAALLVAETARLAVDHAKRAHVVVVRSFERNPGVKAQLRIPGDDRIVLESLVRRRVRHLENAITENRMGTQRDVPRRLRNIQTDATLEPLPVFVHERDERNRRAANE